MTGPDRKTLRSDFVVVLDRTQDLVNIAGVIRVMMNMGFERLRLVNPVEFDAYRIEGIAHRSMPLIEGAELFDSLDAALADCTVVVGTTGVGRTATRNWMHPREGAPTLLAHAAEGGTVALLFGREDWGLDTETLDRCTHVLTIPTDPAYPSLNLAQAFLVVAYELFLAAGEPPELPRGRRADRPASQTELANMYRALQAGLGHISFFKGTRPPEAIMRALATALSRATLDRREAKLFEAIGYEMVNALERARAGADPWDGHPTRPESPEDPE